MNNCKEYDRKTEKRIAAPSETFVLTITDEECYNFAAKNPHACMWDESRLKYIEMI